MERWSGGDLVASLYNAAWPIRQYGPRPRTELLRLKRAQAIQLLGLTVRHAFNTSDDFEPLLIALFDALSAKSNDPPF